VECGASAPRFLRCEIEEPRAIEPLFVGFGRFDDLYRSTLGSGQAGGGDARSVHSSILGAEGTELNAPMLTSRLGSLVHQRRRLGLAEGR